MWATSSSGAASIAPVWTWLAVVIVAGVGRPAALPAQVLLTQSEALRLAFPEPASIERRTAYLEESQLEAARRLAGGEVEVNQSVVTYYVGVRDGQPIGVAYFDAHRVRTLPEVVMIVVSPTARIDRIEILKFSEPPEYRAPEGWLRQFNGKALGEELRTKGGIVNMTGATLTTRAITEASRRVLALHEVIRPLEAWSSGRSNDTL